MTERFGKRRKPADERMGVISRVNPRELETLTPEEIRDRRSQNMITVGVAALVIAFIALMNGAAIGLLFALLGVGLLVGGLIVRP